MSNSLKDVWTGLFTIVPDADNNWEEMKNCAGAVVNVFATANSSQEFERRVKGQLDDWSFSIERLEGIQRFSKVIADEQTDTDSMVLATQAASKSEVIFDDFHIYEKGDTELNILEKAISDIGHFSWWDEQLPKSVQVEFGGVQLWCSEPKEDEPARGVVTLRFYEVESLSFLTHQDAPADLPENWPDLLHEDKLELPSITPEQLHVEDDYFFRKVRQQAKRIETRFGVSPNELRFFEAPCILAFWAGDIGMMVSAQRMEIINQTGVVPLDEVEVLHEKWWEYWKEYWDRRDTDNPMPEDIACENTIPMEDEEMDKNQ